MPALVVVEADAAAAWVDEGVSVEPEAAPEEGAVARAVGFDRVELLSPRPVAFLSWSTRPGVAVPVAEAVLLPAGSRGFFAGLPVVVGLGLADAVLLPPRMPARTAPAPAAAAPAASPAVGDSVGTGDAPDAAELADAAADANAVGAGVTADSVGTGADADSVGTGDAAESVEEEAAAVVGAGLGALEVLGVLEGLLSAAAVVAGAEEVAISPLLMFTFFSAGLTFPGFLGTTNWGLSVTEVLMIVDSPLSTERSLQTSD